MKNIRVVFSGVVVVMIGLLVTSCAPIFYYQVYKVQPINNLSKSNNSLIYEDENCKVFYDFWDEGGSVGFLIYNKLDKNIYVNMKESFFIRNGIAYDYYKDREFTSLNTTSRSSMYTYSESNSYNAMMAIVASASVSGYNYQGFKQTISISAGFGTSKTTNYGLFSSSAYSNTSSSGVNFKEKEIVCIPPKSAKVISEYSINMLLYRDCNLFLYPTTKNGIRTSNFSEEDSPYVFSNRISYTIEGSDNQIKMEHKFYVSEISNYSSTDIVEYKTDEYCKDEQPPMQRTAYFKNYSPDKFYIEYSATIYGRKH